MNAYRQAVQYEAEKVFTVWLRPGADWEIAAETSAKDCNIELHHVLEYLDKLIAKSVDTQPA